MTFEVWYLIGAALVFFMQAGFAMVETGFTRAKNAGNIIMKNLMDFCIGTVAFLLLGAGLLLGEDALGGFLGLPNFDWITQFKVAAETGNYSYVSQFVFNLVFCATTATIVSGAMAERTKFSSYCVYSFIMSLVVYPVEAHWIWGGGWLAQLGFHDFAGSTAIHMVGGIAALVGAIFLGPRIGKYTRDAKGKVVKVNAIPGHSLTLGALGCFILWFGWYGFNGAAANSTLSLGQIFINTTIAPAVASCACMCYTWIKNGKPDVSMTLNASLAGLVAITAPCAVVPAWASVIIGFVAGILVVVVVEGLDKKLHIDDPVGAVGVHMANGIWGTIAVGLFADPELAAYWGLADGGLFMTGHFTQLGLQLLGFVTVAAWAAVTMIATFFILSKVQKGIRVSRTEEIEGLDKMEHGMPSAYADFTAVSLNSEILAEGEPEGTGVEVVETSVPVVASAVDAKMSKIVIITKQPRLEALKTALEQIGVTGLTVTQVLGCGVQKGATEMYRGVPIEMSLLPKVKVEVVVSKVPVETVVETARKALYTGHIGDGKIFVYNVENVVKVRTGASGYDALQDEAE
ncbi:MAG: ammonium transporter [Clostridia bacterium]|nr:ammonium transporter [Clostridia bacterium]